MSQNNHYHLHLTHQTLVKFENQVILVKKIEFKKKKKKKAYLKKDKAACSANFPASNPKIIRKIEQTSWYPW